MAKNQVPTNRPPMTEMEQLENGIFYAYNLLVSDNNLKGNIATDSYSQQLIRKP